MERWYWTVRADSPCSSFRQVRLHVLGREPLELVVAQSRTDVAPDLGRVALVRPGGLLRLDYVFQPAGEKVADRLSVRRHRLPVRVLRLEASELVGHLAAGDAVEVLPGPLAVDPAEMDTRHPAAVLPLIDRPLVVAPPALFRHPVPVLGILKVLRTPRAFGLAALLCRERTYEVMKFLLSLRRWFG